MYWKGTMNVLPKYYQGTTEALNMYQLHVHLQYIGIGMMVQGQYVYIVMYPSPDRCPYFYFCSCLFHAC
jgi:hypothetical protein